MKNIMIDIEQFIPSSLGNGKHIHIKIKSNDADLKNCMLMLHGKNLPPEYSYEAKLDGKSSVDLFVEQGITCITMSAMGYGKSSTYESLELEENADFSINTYTDWTRDITDVVNHINTSITLLGWSASAPPAAMVACNNPLVNGVVIYGFPRHVYIGGPKLQKCNYTYYNIDYQHHRRYKDIPQHLTAEVLPDNWYHSWINRIRLGMPFKIPEGTTNDRIDVLFNGKSLDDFFKWESISQPIMFTSGEWDTDCDIKEYDKYYARCSNPRSVIDIIPNGTHWVLLEKNRVVMVDKITQFVKDNNVSAS